MSEAAYVRISGLAKAFGRTSVLHGVDVALPRGELLALLGPSGCGKTTMLRIIAGLLAADAGEVAIDGQALGRLPPHRRDIGVVFQSYALFPHMSVGGNVGFGLQMRGVPRAEAAARVAAALQLVQLGRLAARPPAELSGGQQQRVALARAMVIRPRLLLLDEPLSNLDALLRAAMRVDIRALHVRTGMTTLLVTHDQSEAMTMADRIAVMARGRIEQVGTPQQIYDDPQSAFVAGFVGSPAASLLPVTAAGDGRLRVGGGSGVGGPLWQPPPALAQASDAAPAAAALLCLRPERLRLVDAAAAHALAGQVVAVEFLGADWLVHVAVGDSRVVVRCASDAAVPPGPVGIALTHLPPRFDAASGRRLR